METHVGPLAVGNPAPGMSSVGCNPSQCGPWGKLGESLTASWAVLGPAGVLGGG